MTAAEKPSPWGEAFCVVCPLGCSRPGKSIEWVNRTGEQGSPLHILGLLHVIFYKTTGSARYRAEPVCVVYGLVV